MYIRVYGWVHKWVCIEALESYKCVNYRNQFARLIADVLSPIIKLKYAILIIKIHYVLSIIASDRMYLSTLSVCYAVFQNNPPMITVFR